MAGACRDYQGSGGGESGCGEDGLMGVPGISPNLLIFPQEGEGIMGTENRFCAEIFSRLEPWIADVQNSKVMEDSPNVPTTSDFQFSTIWGNEVFLEVKMFKNQNLFCIVLTSL